MCITLLPVSHVLATFPFSPRSVHIQGCRFTNLTFESMCHMKGLISGVKSTRLKLLFGWLDTGSLM